jgi:predicted CoA-substrate-specific enzyme activase
VIINFRVPEDSPEPTGIFVIVAGIDIGSRSSQTVILMDGGNLVYSNIETGPDSVQTACPHAVFPSARTILDMGGQDCKAIRCDESGMIADFTMNDKCAGGTGRFFEIIADVLGIPLKDIGPLSLKANGGLTFNTRCAIFAKSNAMALLRQNVDKREILAGLHDAVSRRVINLLKTVGIVPGLSITGGIAKNIGMVKSLERKLGMGLLIPDEPQIMGALGAALFAQDCVQ